MLIRKKCLKIQERLGMRIGVAYGNSSIPTVKTTDQALRVLEELYKIGFKAFMLPQELFSGIKSISGLYKEHYNSLLKIKMLANKYNIELGIHNHSLPEEPYMDDALKIFLNIASVMDVRTIIFHPTFYKMMPQDQALKLVVHKINEMLTEVRLGSTIGIETTGKLSELGSLDDVIDISKRTRKAEPVLNWAHIHARGAGSLRTEDDFKKVIQKVKGDIGQGWLGNAYFIFSGISYGPSGEIDHKPFARAEPSLEFLIRSIVSFNIKGTLIFETPDREKGILNILKEFGDMVR
jgi:endonuclease IV